MSKSDIYVPDPVLKKIPKIKKRTITSDRRFLYQNLGIYDIRKLIYLPGGTLSNSYKAVSKSKIYKIKVNLFNGYFRAFSFYNDLWVMHKLKKMRLPNVRVYDVSVMNKKKDYEVCDYIRYPNINSLRKEKKTLELILFQLGGIIGKIHNCKLTGFGPLNIKKKTITGYPSGSIKSWREYIFTNLDAHIDFCLKRKIITKKTMLEIKEVLLRAIPLLDGVKKGVLLHGDLSPTNIFYGEGGIKGIIDWEDALAGDSAFDVAMFGTFKYGEEFFDEFFEGYSSTQPIDDDFWIRYWLYYLRISLAKTVHRTRFGYPDKFGNAKASHRIITGLDKLKACTKYPSP